MVGISKLMVVRVEEKGGSLMAAKERGRVMVEQGC